MMRDNNSFLNRDELDQIGFAHVGKNVLISKKASIYGAEGIEVGDNVRIDDFCILSGRIIIHNYIHISALCCLYGGTSGIELMDYSGISSRCAVYAISDDFSGNAMINPMISKEFRKVTDSKVVIDKYSQLGSGSTVLPGVHIGQGVSLGSMSLVKKNLEPWGIYAGIPCRRIKDRSKHLIELEAEFRKAYEKDYQDIE